MRSLFTILLFLVLVFVPFLNAQIVVEEIEPLEDDDPRLANPRTNLSIE
jgi:hypothetical protein